MSELQQKVTDTYKQLGRPISIEQWDDLQREISETGREAKNADKAVKNFNETAELVGAAAGKIADGASKVADATKGISAAADVAAGSLVGLAVNAGKTADDLNTLSKQSGFSTQTLQEWTYAADLVDVSVDNIIDAARKIKKNMGSETAETQEAFAKLGVSVSQTSIKVTSNARVKLPPELTGMPKFQLDDCIVQAHLGITDTWLVRKYIYEQISQADLAEELDWTRGTVSKGCEK